MKTFCIATSLLLLCAVAHVAAAFTDGLLPNGNFEMGPKPSQMKGRKVIDPDAIPYWKLSGTVEYILSGQKQQYMMLVVPEGHSAVRLGNGGSIGQRVPVTKGTFYALTFSASRTCAQEESLNISVSTTDSGVLPIHTVYSSDGWDTYAWAFHPKVDVIDVLIRNPGNEKDPVCGPLVDAIAISAIYPPKLTTKNILKNGDFEVGPYVFPNNTCGVLIPPNVEDQHSPLPGWMVESLKAVRYIGADHFYVPQGKRAVELLAGMESALSQIARTVAGKTYALTFSMGDAGDGCEGPMQVEAYAAKSLVKVPYTSKGKGGFKRGVLRFTAMGNRTRVLFMSSNYSTRNDGSLCGPVVDDITLLASR